MSDDTQGNEARETARLLDADGREIPRAVRPPGDALAWIEDYINAQPARAALVALGAGYLAGRLRLARILGLF